MLESWRSYEGFVEVFEFREGGWRNEFQVAWEKLKAAKRLKAATQIPLYHTLYNKFMNSKFIFKHFAVNHIMFLL